MRGISDRHGRWQVITRTALLVAVGVISTGVAMAQLQPVCVSPPLGMVAWWPGDGNTFDIVGGDMGTWNGTSAYTAGEVGQAFSFNGSSWVQAASTPSLSPTAAITIDAWIQPQATASNRIVDKITAGGADGYLLDLLSNHLRLIVDGKSVSGSTTLSSGVTYHVAGTFDGSTLNVYVNGVNDGSLVATTTIPTNSLPLRIGADQTGANRFSGWIDEVEIFNRALSQSEIQAIFNAGSAGKCKPQPIPATSSLGFAVLALLVIAAGLLFLGR
jgi:hypothetical protein